MHADRHQSFREEDEERRLQQQQKKEESARDVSLYTLLVFFSRHYSPFKEFYLRTVADTEEEEEEDETEEETEETEEDGEIDELIF